MRLFIMALIVFHMSAARTLYADAGLGLQEAIAISLRQNAGLLAAKHDADAARANERGARALANPEVVVVPGIAGDAGSDEELSVTQPLEVNGQRRTRTQIARSEADASEAAYKASERDVIRSVKQSYWDVAQAESMVGLDRKNVELAEALYRAAQRQFDVGSAPGSQATKAQVELARARQELITAESDLAQAKALLNTLLGRRADTPFEPTDELAFSPIAVIADVLHTASEKNRPELAEAQAILAARRAEIRAASVRRRPDLAIQARQETLGGEGGLAIGITIPLVDWGSIRHDRKRAEASADAQAKRVEAVRNAVLLDVEAALREAGRAEKLIREYQESILSQAERLAEMAQQGYAAGATGYLEVLEAQRTLRTVRAEYYVALADHQRSLAQLEWAAGTDLSSITAKEEAK